MNKFTYWRKINTYRTFSSRMPPQERKDLRDKLLQALESKDEYEWLTKKEDETDLHDVQIIDKDDDKKISSNDYVDYSMTRTNLERLRAIQLEIANILHDEHFENFKTSPHFSTFQESYEAARKRQAEMLDAGNEEDDNPTDNEDDDNRTILSDGKAASAFEPYEHLLQVKWQKKSGSKAPKQKTKLFNFPAAKTVLTIGRASSNDITISDSGISRTHCRVDWTPSSENEAGDCILVDMGSTFGTKLNGKAVQRARLRVGDVITVGKSTSVTLVTRDMVKGQKPSCVVS